MADSSTSALTTSTTGDGGMERSSSGASSQPVTFKAFLDKMRHPAAADLVRSIKNFIQDMLKADATPDAQSSAVQDFLARTEQSFRAHPLWKESKEDELEAAGEGLEKYLMTKLHEKTFGQNLVDREQDEHLSALLSALTFVKPEHLDIPTKVRKESSWLMAQKELQKINTYKAPRDKLVCILNCCYIINNVLGVSQAGNPDGFGADDFLPILIYVVIHAAPAYLESNLQYIQRFRKYSRLSSEAAYFFTNVLSACSFISTINADSLTIERQDFIKHMREAGIPFPDSAEEASPLIDVPTDLPRPVIATQTSGPLIQLDQAGSSSSSQAAQPGPPLPPLRSIPAFPQFLDELQRGGVPLVAKAEGEGAGMRNSYRYMEATTAELKVADVASLLGDYKDLALKYECLLRGLEAWVETERKGGPGASTTASHATPPPPPASAPDLVDAPAHPPPASTGTPPLLSDMPQPPTATKTIASAYPQPPAPQYPPNEFNSQGRGTVNVVDLINLASG